MTQLKRYPPYTTVFGVCRDLYAQDDIGDYGDYPQDLLVECLRKKFVKMVAGGPGKNLKLTRLGKHVATD